MTIGGGVVRGHPLALSTPAGDACGQRYDKPAFMTLGPGRSPRVVPVAVWLL